MGYPVPVPTPPRTPPAPPKPNDSTNAIRLKEGHAVMAVTVCNWQTKNLGIAKILANQNFINHYK